MAIPLKQSTAATLVIGQFVDYFDAYTPETGLTAGTVDEIGVWKAGATAITDTSGTTTFTHRANGEYTITLSTDDTNTLGPLWVMVKDADVCLGVRLECTVYPANVYDSLFAGSDYLQTDAHQIEGADATTTIEGSVQTVVETNKLDHLVAVADSDDAVNDSIVAKLAASDGDWSGYDKTTDSLEAVRDHIGDGTNLTEAGGTGDQFTGIASVGAVAGAVGSVTGAVGSVTGNVGGNVAGSVGSVTGAVGSVTGDVGGNVVGSVANVVGGLNTGAGVITTLDGLDTAQDAQHSTTQAAIAALHDFDPAGDTVAHVTLVDTVTTNTDMRGTDSALTTLSTAIKNSIADHVLRRSLATAEASADGDALTFRSLLGAIAKLVNKVSISGTTLTVTKTDDTTALGTQTLTTDASADPVTGADTN